MDNKKSPKTPAVLMSLPADELAKVVPLSEENIRGALEEGKRQRDAAAVPVQQGAINSHVLFA